MSDELERLRAEVRALEQKRLELNVEIGERDAEIGRLRKIRCHENPGGHHRWDWDGQCLTCGNYATDLIDAATD